MLESEQSGTRGADLFTYHCTCTHSPARTEESFDPFPPERHTFVHDQADCIGGSSPPGCFQNRKAVMEPLEGLLALYPAKHVSMPVEHTNLRCS